MQAIVQERYGGPEVLVSREIDRPGIGDGEVLVRVHAAGLHIGDVFGVRGSPFPVRFTSGLRGPKLGVPGFDIAGTVEATGSAVTRFAPGDEVFGFCTLAVIRRVRRVRAGRRGHAPRKPSGLSFEQAAAIPTSASAALHGLRDAGRLQAGQRVLINGASGGVGTYAVQIARAFGAEVTGVCGPTNVELVRSLGAHHVIDYTREDFTRGTAALRPDPRQHREPLPRGLPTSPGARRHPRPHERHGRERPGAAGPADPTGRDVPLREAQPAPTLLQPEPRRISRSSSSMVEEGTLRPVIDATYPLSETAAALRHIEAGHARGKVVVAI